MLLSMLLVCFRVWWKYGLLFSVESVPLLVVQSLHDTIMHLSLNVAGAETAWKVGLGLHVLSW